MHNSCRVINLIGGNVVDDKHNEVFRLYDLKVYNMYRARGAFFLETNQGLKLYKNYEGSINHLEYENKIKRVLFNCQYENVDLVVPNKNGEYLTEDSMGDKYIIKNWFSGDECSLHDVDSIVNATNNLANIHNCMRNIDFSEDEKKYYSQDQSIELFAKHNRELKRVKTYIINKKQRNDFELAFLGAYDLFYNQAIEATQKIQDSSYLALYNESIENGIACHGNYTYHNILVSKNGIATTNFDKAVIGIQITDLYLFLRKCMEKNDWKIEYGQRILDEYSKKKPISDEQLEVLKISLQYPEKFWKITNYYFNNKKSWISKRNIQKLENLVQQEEAKKKFLNTLQ